MIHRIVILFCFAALLAGCNRSNENKPTPYKVKPLKSLESVQPLKSLDSVNSDQKSAIPTIGRELMHWDPPTQQPMTQKLLSNEPVTK